MLVNVGDILLDRDKRRAGREVEVIAVGTDSVTIRTVRSSVGGLPITNGTESEVSNVRLGKAYSHKSGHTEKVQEPEKVDESVPEKDGDEFSTADTNESLKNQIIKEIMRLAEPGNRIVLSRIEALESRVNSIEYGGNVYYNTNVSSGTIDSQDVENATVNSFTGSVVSNYPTIEEVLEKVLPETESDDFEYLWERLASSDKNPHEAVVRLVYNLLTK